MQISARLDEEALRRMLGDILPITVLLDDDRGMEGRWVTIGRAQKVDLIAGEGLRLATSGELRWPIKTLPVTVRIASLQLLIRPIVVGAGPSTRVLFRPFIEHADFERLPDLVDRGIVAIVNRALEERSQHLAWHVADTLCQRFALPTTLVPLETASIDVVSAELRIDATTIELAVSLDLDVIRVGGAAASPPGGDGRPAAAP
jgi:hypothetical protein